MTFSIKDIVDLNNRRSQVIRWLEVALLLSASGLIAWLAIEAWFERFVDRPGFEVVPLSYRAACRSYQLHHLEHRDPADRLLIATAIELACPFVTYDERIASFAKRHGRQ